MACNTYRFVCPIEGGGGNRDGTTPDTNNCYWNVTCCDGTKLVYELAPNGIEELCVLDTGSVPKKNTYLGSFSGGSEECLTNCGDADNTPIAGYDYKEYENCTTPSEKQVFRAPAGYASWPTSMLYNSKCWQTPVTTAATSAIDVASLITYANCAACAAVPTPPTPACPPAPSTLPEFCLIQTNTVTVLELDLTAIGLGIVPSYLFNGTTLSDYGTYNVQLGQYTFSDVPQAHPIAILNNGLETLIDYTGENNAGTKVALDGNTYTFYWGDVTVNVNGDFECVSYEGFYEGYMGGENNLRYNSDCSSPVTPTPPTPTPTPVPTSVVPPIPSPVDTDWTLSYSNNAQGWPSFYSFNPDYMIGMNNFFYTFSGGNLYQHNTNELRNNYYGVQYNSQISSVFNESPLQNKVFKTLDLQSDHAWQAYLETDIQDNGNIEDGWFEQKEGSWFAYVRQSGKVPALTGEYAMRSVNGIGKTSNVAVDGGLTILSFSIDPLVSIGSIISIGDYVYHSVPQYTELELGGVVTNIEVDLQNGLNNLYVSTSDTSAVAFPTDDPYIMYIKSSEAESHGLLGHYCLFTVTNFNTSKTELFAVEADVMKSYP